MHLGQRSCEIGGSSLKKTLLKKAANVLMKLKLSHLLRIKMNGFVLRFYPSSVSRVLWVNQYLGVQSYPEEQRFLTRYLKVGDVVIDVGANVGFLTLLSSTIVGRCGRVYAFEPHPRVYRYLEGNVVLNRAENVRMFNVAVGELDGIVGFSDNKKDDDRNAVVCGESFIMVPARRLDQFDFGGDHISLLKIDCEGYEKFVLEGAIGLLDRVQCVFFEAVEEHFVRFGYGLQDLLSILTEEHFCILRIEGNKLWIVSPNGGPRLPKNLIAVKSVGEFIERTRFELVSADRRL
jgi:FkbM family methyltransferase